MESFNVSAAEIHPPINDDVQVPVDCRLSRIRCMGVFFHFLSATVDLADMVCLIHMALTHDSAVDCPSGFVKQLVKNRCCFCRNINYKAVLLPEAKLGA